MPNHYKVTFLVNARRDIAQIHQYLVNDLCTPTGAHNFSTNLNKTVNHIKVFPASLPVVLTWSATGQEVRAVGIGRYVAYYVIADSIGEVQILRVLHSLQITDGKFV